MKKWVKFILIGWAILIGASQLQAGDEYTLYTLAMFKCGIKSGGAISPNVSASLEKLCISSYFAYNSNSAYVFAIVPTSLNLTLVALTNFLLPLSPEEELEFKSIIDIARTELDYANGVKARPTPDMSKALN